MKYLLMILLLSSCATIEKCSDIEDGKDRAKCFENKKQARFYNDSGWRFIHPRAF